MRVLRARRAEPAAADGRADPRRLQPAAVDPRRRADHVRPPQQSFAGGRRRRSRLPWRGGVRYRRAAQRAPVGSAQPRPAGADLRPQMPGLRSLYPPCARTDRPPARSWRRRHERSGRPRGSAWACQALLGEAARPAPHRQASRRDAAASARSRSRGSGPIRASRASISTKRRSTSSPQSIAERGVLQPILLRPDGDGFQIIAGERRWRAAQRAQLHAIPGDRPRFRRSWRPPSWR